MLVMHRPQVPLAQPSTLQQTSRAVRRPAISCLLQGPAGPVHCLQLGAGGLRGGAAAGGGDGRAGRDAGALRCAVLRCAVLGHAVLGWTCWVRCGCAALRCCAVLCHAALLCQGASLQPMPKHYFCRRLCVPPLPACPSLVRHPPHPRRSSTPRPFFPTRCRALTLCSSDPPSSFPRRCRACRATTTPTPPCCPSARRAASWPPRCACSRRCRRRG